MSQEMNQSTQNASANQPQEPKKDNTKVVLIVIIVLLLISNIYFIVSRSNVAGERDIARSEYNAADSSRIAVETDYNAALARLDELVTDNAQIQQELGDRNSEIAKLKREIDKIVKNKNATASEYEGAKL
jgi:flagellar basal body-associated protein FliL